MSDNSYSLDDRVYDDPHQAKVDLLRHKISKLSQDRGAAGWSRRDQHVTARASRNAEDPNDAELRERQELEQAYLAEKRIKARAAAAVDPALLLQDASSAPAQERAGFPEFPALITLLRQTQREASEYSAALAEVAEIQCSPRGQACVAKIQAVLRGYVSLLHFRAILLAFALSSRLADGGVEHPVYDRLVAINAQVDALKPRVQQAIARSIQLEDGESDSGDAGEDGSAEDAPPGSEQEGGRDGVSDGADESEDESSAAFEDSVISLSALRLEEPSAKHAAPGSADAAAALRRDLVGGDPDSDGDGAVAGSAARGPRGGPRGGPSGDSMARTHEDSLREHRERKMAAKRAEKPDVRPVYARDDSASAPADGSARGEAADLLALARRAGAKALAAPARRGAEPEDAAYRSRVHNPYTNRIPARGTRGAEDGDGDGGAVRRPVTANIAKGTGDMHRNKNKKRKTPRTNMRKKYEDAAQKMRQAVGPRRDQAGAYAGEHRGIDASDVRSRRI